MKISIYFEVEVDSEKVAKNVVQALLIDIDDSSEFFERSKLMLFNKGEKIFLEINAYDLIAAKSSINTTFNWIENSIAIFAEFSK